MSNILIMGAGGFGIALGVMAHEHGHRVTMWTPFEQEAAQLCKEREHKKLLAGIRISPEIAIATGLEAAETADLVLIATPSFAVRETAKRLAAVLPPGIAVACVSKGLEDESLKTLSTVISEELPRNPVVMLSGPSHAEEVAKGCATTVVAACRNRAAAELVQDILMNDTFRIYTSDDVLGIELGGAVKNVIALAAGILDGLGAGDNTKAALMTRGIAEISRLGVALGANRETFGGLSGIGDLIVTCASMHSRNRRCGILIGQGVPVAEAIEQIGMTVEGYRCAKAVYQLSKRHGVYMPIVREAYLVLYEDKTPQEAQRDLMALPKRHESESVWLLTKGAAER